MLFEIQLLETLKIETMPEKLINIRTDKFTKQEIKVIEDSLKEWNFEWIVDIVYFGESENDCLDVSFTLEHENLGEFLWVIFSCGHESVYKGI